MFFLRSAERDETVIRMLQFVAGKREAKLLQSVPERGAAGVLAEDKMILGYAHQRGCHDL